MPSDGMINEDFVRSVVTADDRWCASHGADQEAGDLGAGILYYAFAYALKARVCVCLGSGGGFVPRLMRQAQRDLAIDPARTILVDGGPNVTPERREIWGSPSWVDPASTFRTNYPDVEILLMLTADAFRDVFQPQRIAIDYLHIDADHHYEGVKRDWELFHPVVADHGVITFHDTVNYREPCGVPRLVDEIRTSGEYEVLNLPVAYGTAAVKRILDRDANIAASRSGIPADVRRR